MFNYKAYTASSVIKAVAANENLSTRSEHWGCSLKLKYPLKQMDILECYRGNAMQCEEKRAQRHKCRRYLYVDYYVDNRKQPLAVLPFDFTISAANSDGFIDVDNSMLAILISGNHINTNALVPVEVIFD